MGAYVSSANCAAQHGISPNCSVVLSSDNTTAILLGDAAFGNFQSDPDIAGIGVLGAFLSVTAVSLVLAILSTIWWSIKNVFGCKNRFTEEERTLRSSRTSITGILEALIVTCSDQQVFTGGAYAITLRYAKACSVSAYHYNIVTSILLVTCATHLMAMTVSKNYWRHPYVAFLRIAVTTLLFVVTGILMANAGSGSLGFPTQVPPSSAQYSLMLLPAACFQTGDKSHLTTEIDKALESGSLEAFFTGQIHGWANYIIMFLFYFIAVVVSFGRVIRRGSGHHGKRKSFIEWLQRATPRAFRHKRFFYLLFGLYLVAGIAISVWTVVISALYVVQLRQWVDLSGWVERTNNQNPEYDPSTFGQLVPVLLMSLTVFTFLQLISERVHENRAMKHTHTPSYPSPRRDSQSSTRHPSRYTTLSSTKISHGLGIPADSQPHSLPNDYPHTLLSTNSSNGNEKDKTKPVVDVHIVQEPIDIEAAMTPQLPQQQLQQQRGGSSALGSSVTSSRKNTDTSTTTGTGTAGGQGGGSENAAPVERSVSPWPLPATPHDQEQSTN